MYDCEFAVTLMANIINIAKINLFITILFILNQYFFFNEEVVSTPWKVDLPLPQALQHFERRLATLREW
jgi:hypothetical protein